MRVAYLTAGAAGMYCGSCLNDNALARGLLHHGVDCLLIPLYTPIRVDGESVSLDRVFFGGINVYLDQRFPSFSKLPRWMTRWLDHPWLLNRVTRLAGGTNAQELGALANSMLMGTEGRQRRESLELCHWLANEVNPDVIIFTNLLIGGCIPELKDRLKVPLIVMLQGDDLFLDFVPQPWRDQCLSQVRQLAQHVDGFITATEFYANKMSNLFHVSRERFSVVPLGIDLGPYSGAMPLESHRPRTIGYLARLAPEKGLHLLIDAFIELRQNVQMSDVRLQVAGWLGTEHKKYAQEQWKKLKSVGLESSYEYLGSPEQGEKIQFLQGLDVMCVPATFEEPKGLYVLEGFAMGVPVVGPDHGAFPELFRSLNSGVSFAAGDPTALRDALFKVLSNLSEAKVSASAAQRRIHANRSIETVSATLLEILRHRRDVS
jgi:glycosyltransferase involved in cell wall biosynthesis